MRIPTLLPSGRPRSGTRRPSVTVALDIGADAIVALQSSGTERARSRRAFVHPLPAGIVVDGEVVDALGLAAQLRELFDEHKLARDVRVGLAHPRLMVRMVELPGSLAGRDLDAAVRHLAGELLPVGLAQLVVDYRRLAPGASLSEAGQQRVLMAAARIDGIEVLTQALEAAELRVQSIGLSALAVVAALDAPPARNQAILYVQAGALTNVVVTEDGEPLLVRSVSAGSESIVSALAERARISLDRARAHASAIGIGTAVHPGATAIDDELTANVAQQVREGLRRIIAEIQSSRGVYAARPESRPIGAVVLTGALTTWPGVAATLESELHLPVLLAERGSWPDLGGVSIAPERLDVAIGLSRAADDERPDLRPESIVRAREAGPTTRLAQAACVMAAALAALVVYYVAVANQVSSGRERLGTIGGELVTAEREAATLKPYHDFATATTQRRAAITTVAGTRFNWDRSLTELSKVAPRGVWLTSARATLTPQTQVAGSSGEGGTAALRGALQRPALELAGCATRESALPAYMDRLHAMTGVTEVGFSRTERLERNAGGKPAGTGDCRGGNPRTARFALVSYFEPTPALPSAAAATAPTASAPPGTASLAPRNQTAALTTGGRP